MATRYTQRKNRMVHVTRVRDDKDLGFWETAAGFNLTAEKVQWGEGPVATGVRSRGNATLGRPLSDVEAGKFEVELEASEATSDQFRITSAWKGDDGMPLGDPRGFTGVILEVNGPDSDKSASERGMFEIVLALEVAAS